MGQTVNLLLLASVVRIHHYPQKSCNHLITTLLLSIPITIKPLTQHPEIVDPGSVELLGQS